MQVRHEARLKSREIVWNEFNTFVPLVSDTRYKSKIKKIIHSFFWIMAGLRKCVAVFWLAVKGRKLTFFGYKMYWENKNTTYMFCSMLFYRRFDSLLYLFNFFLI